MPDSSVSGTVFVVDDDEAVLDSLQLLLENHGFNVACFSSGEDLLSALGNEDFRPQPDCVVVDVRLPGLSGLELQKRLRECRREFPVILITGHGDIEMAVRAVKAGAFDFIEKPFNDRRLLDSIGTAMAHATRNRIEKDESSVLIARRDELSARQRQVMDLVVRGMVNKEIGERLGISPRTVEIYRARVMEKMGARNLADLVRIALALEHDGGSDPSGKAK